MDNQADGQGHNLVTTDDKGVVVTVFRGKQNAETMNRAYQQMSEHIDNLRRHNKKVLILSDIRSLSMQDSGPEAREASKKMLSLYSDATAIVGNNAMLSMTMYIIRLARPRALVKYFRSEKAAYEWLDKARQPRKPRTMVSLVAGIVLGLVGVLALARWFVRGAHTTSLLQHFGPMNPLVAIGLIAVGYGFLCYWLGKLRQLHYAGIFGIVLGLLALLPLGVENLLFREQVRLAGPHAAFAIPAAVCFITIGLATFTVGTKRFIVRICQYFLGLVIIGTSLFNIFGVLYAPDFMNSFRSSFVMPLSVSLALLGAGVSMVLLVVFRQVGVVLSGFARIGWLMVVSLVLVQVATYGAWSQAVSRNLAASKDAFVALSSDVSNQVDQRIEAYINALHGFRGLFKSSDYVDQASFQGYYDSLDLARDYPGLQALTFISKVQEKDLPAFVAKHRADKSLNPAGNPNFAITSKSTLPVHYIVTYSATTTTAGGNDLGSNPSRRVAFEKADASGAPVSSGTVEFPGTNGAPAERGFFITIPVTSKSSGGTVIGFVNAVFYYKEFFDNTFVPKSSLDDMTLIVTDTMDNIDIFASLQGGQAKQAAASTSLRIAVADHRWKLSMFVPPGFGVNSSLLSLPRIILLGGQLFSVLLIFIFVLQARSRRQGFEIADSLTQDLTIERNRAVASDEKSKTILLSIGDAVFAVDKNQRITLFNPSAQHISGFSEAEAIGKPYDEVLHFEIEKTGQINREFVRQALQGEITTMTNHTVLTRKDGSRVAVADSAAPIRDGKGEIEGAIIVFRDVTKDYELDRAKTEFVSLASHQLRTPLSAINWYSELLLNGDAGKLNKDQHEYVTEIFEGNVRMVELVNSLLDVSRIEVGKLPNNPETTDLVELVSSVQKELTTSIQNKQLKVTLAVSKVPPALADPKQLRMVVQNLMSNAVKYTPDKGSVTITLRQATPADISTARLKTKEAWYFSVEDTGYGIPQAQQAKIFTKLYRADNVRKLDVEGTGLGLYIVKEVVDMMGGQVWFKSIESAGTTFHVVVPYKGRHQE